MGVAETPWLVCLCIGVLVNSEANRCSAWLLIANFSRRISARRAVWRRTGSCQLCACAVERPRSQNIAFDALPARSLQNSMVGMDSSGVGEICVDGLDACNVAEKYKPVTEFSKYGMQFLTLSF